MERFCLLGQATRGKSDVNGICGTENRPGRAELFERNTA